jgi:hypothetical protein
MYLKPHCPLHVSTGIGHHRVFQNCSVETAMLAFFILMYDVYEGGKTSQKLRDLNKAMHNPRMRIYGTNICNFD